MGTRLASVGLAAAVGLGGLTVAAVNPLAIAGAQDAETSQAAEPEARSGALQRALDRLVADGTITQAQADAVLATTKEEARAAHEERREARSIRRTELLQTAADALGTTPDAVKQGLKDGVSLAAQAEAAGVERQALDDALTGLLGDRIDTAVADGRLTEERAAKAREHLDAAVDRIIDADGSGHGGPGGPSGDRRDRIRERLQDRFGN